MTWNLQSWLQLWGSLCLLWREFSQKGMKACRERSEIKLRKGELSTSYVKNWHIELQHSLKTTEIDLIQLAKNNNNIINGNNNIINGNNNDTKKQQLSLTITTITCPFSFICISWSDGQGRAKNVHEINSTQMWTWLQPGDKAVTEDHMKLLIL